MTSITLTVTGESSLLHSYFHPEIELDENSNYSCSLLDFYTYNSIPNVHENNNKFHYSLTQKGDIEIITIPVGSYEVDQIGAYLEEELLERHKARFYLHANSNTLKCKIDTEVFIDFTQANSIATILGFSKRKLIADSIHLSDKLVNIQSVNSIRINCDLTSGSFHNGQSTHTIYEFSPSVAPGYKINEQPKHLIYLPVVKRRINELNISIVDQDGRLVDFRGEQLTCRVHIRKDS